MLAVVVVVGEVGKIVVTSTNGGGGIRDGRTSSVV